MDPHREFNCHVVVFTGGLWGHTRPMCAFVARLVQAREKLAISFMTTPSLVGRARNEVSKFFESSTSSLEASIRFISLPEGVEFFNSEFDGVRHDFAEAYEQLLLQNLPYPAAFVSEFTMPVANEIVRTRSRGITKLICWAPSALSGFSSALSGFEEKTIDALISEMKTQAKIQGKSYQEISYHRFVNSPQGRIIHLPDLPNIYDYELFPQQSEEDSVPSVRGEIFYNAIQNMTKCDGAIGGTSRALEPETCALLDSTLGKRGAAFFALGPLLPDSMLKQTASSHHPGSDFMALKSFLDRMLMDKGENSVLYISFGSILPPLEPQKLWAFVETVIEKGIPFILSNTSFDLPIPAHILTATAEGGIGFLRQWLPQESILSNPATGWFLSHCGFNSTLESLVAGVPMICWPQEYDQPIIAVNVSQVLGCGFELNEIRRGLGLKPRHSNLTPPLGTVEAVKAEAITIIEKAFFGEEGKSARERALQISGVLRAEWDICNDDQAGGAVRDLQRFIDKYLSPAAGD